MSVQTTKLMTADELLAMPDDGAHRYELVDGELITMSPTSSEHSKIALYIGGHLMQYVLARRLGDVHGADGGFIIRRAPDTVLAPDAGFVRRERLVPHQGYFPGTPDLAVEVISPNDRRRDVEAKVRTYLAAGTRVVIVVDPKKRTATITTATGSTAVDIDGALSAGDIVPGWSLPMRELFAVVS